MEPGKDRKLRCASSNAAASIALLPVSVSQRTTLCGSANDPALSRWSQPSGPTCALHAMAAHAMDRL